MNLENPQLEPDEPQTSEAFRSFDFSEVDRRLAEATVPPWREAQLARMRKTQIHPTDRRNMPPQMP
jgi:hypothetical protein